jgi:uncharacterized protein YqgV (UPF0045/DUF77 family)
LVEPFVEGRPGRHVEAAIAPLEAAGFAVEVGPFSSTFSGDLAELASAVEAMLIATFEAGTTAVQLRVTRDE